MKKHAIALALVGPVFCGLALLFVLGADWKASSEPEESAVWFDEIVDGVLYQAEGGTPYCAHDHEWKLCDPLAGSKYCKGGDSPERCLDGVKVTVEQRGVDLRWKDGPIGQGAGATATHAIIDPELEAGNYLIEGVGADGRAYEGFLTVTPILNPHSGPTEKLVFEGEYRGGQTVITDATIDGDVVSYLFQMTSTGRDKDGKPAVAVEYGYGHFRWSEGHWRGKWSVPGSPAAGTETLTPTTRTLESLRDEWKTPKREA